MNANWKTCRHCGERFDLSTCYTSPANHERDLENWARHARGECSERKETVTLQGEWISSDEFAPFEDGPETLTYSEPDDIEQCWIDGCEERALFSSIYCEGHDNGH